MSLVVQTLLDLAARLENPEDRFLLSAPLWRLAKNDDNLMELFRQEPERGIGGPIGVFVLARAYTPSEFQDMCSEFGAVALDAASWCWGADEGDRLAAWCWSGESSRYFRQWCERQGTGDLLDLVSRAIDTGREDMDKAFRERGLRVAVDVLSRRRLFGDERIRLANELGRCVNELGKDLISELVCSLLRTLDIGRDFLSDDTQWRVNAARSLAVPSTPLGPSAIKEVMAQVLDSRLSLSTSADLKECEGVTFEGREWVGDYLPRRFPEGAGEDGMVEIRDLSWIAFWDGQKETDLKLEGEERKRVGQVRVRWRPRVDLEPWKPQRGGRTKQGGVS